MDDRRLRREMVAMLEADNHAEIGMAVPKNRLNQWLTSIPLALRMLFYGMILLGSLLVGLGYLVYKIDLAVPSWHVEIGWFRVVGVVWFAVCLAVYVGSSYLLSRHGKGAYVEFDPPREFVAAGPFRWVRNPIAACVVGMLIGEAIALSSTGIFLLFLISLPLAHLQVVLLEEPLLRKRFGQAYLDYCRRVPRWIPRRPTERQ